MILIDNMNKQTCISTRASQYSFYLPIYIVKLDILIKIFIFLISNFIRNNKIKQF